MKRGFLGISVSGAHIQCEGIDEVLSGVVDRAGATAVMIDRNVAAPGDENDVFQPPVDGGASVRIFDRPLWGKTSLWVKSGPGHRPNLSFFEGSEYKPAPPNEVTDSAGPVLADFVTSAKGAGLAT
jgi:hypothetical protein